VRQWLLNTDSKTEQWVEAVSCLFHTSYSILTSICLIDSRVPSIFYGGDVPTRSLGSTPRSSRPR
jgi:hypothetical protein